MNLLELKPIAGKDAVFMARIACEICLSFIVENDLAAHSKEEYNAPQMRVM